MKIWSFYCWYTFLILSHFNLFEVLAAILEKDLLGLRRKGEGETKKKERKRRQETGGYRVERELGEKRKFHGRA